MSRGEWEQEVEAINRRGNETVDRHLARGRNPAYIQQRLRPIILHCCTRFRQNHLRSRPLEIEVLEYRMCLLHWLEINWETMTAHNVPNRELCRIPLQQAYQRERLETQTKINTAQER